MTPLASLDRFRVGLVGIGVLAFIAALVTAASSLAVGARHYSAMLEHSAGLRVGEEVQVAGVGVGEVTDIALSNKAVKVSFTVDDDITLGSATAVEVKVATLLGTHFLLVTPRGGGDIGDQAIPVAQTRVPFNLQDVIEVGTPEVNDYDTALIERSLSEVANVLDASGDDLAPALDGVRRLSGLVATRSEDIGELLRAASQVTRQLTSSSGDILDLMRASDLILDTLRSRRETIHALLGDLTRLGTELRGVVEDTRADIGPMLRDLNTTVGVLQDHDRSLDRAITRLNVTARYFANGTGTGPWLDIYTNGANPDGLRP